MDEITKKEKEGEMTTFKAVLILFILPLSVLGILILSYDYEGRSSVKYEHIENPAQAVRTLITEIRGELSETKKQIETLIAITDTVLSHSIPETTNLKIRELNRGITGFSTVSYSSKLKKIHDIATDRPEIQKMCDTLSTNIDRLSNLLSYSSEDKFSGAFDRVVESITKLETSINLEGVVIKELANDSYTTTYEITDYKTMRTAVLITNGSKFSQQGYFTMPVQFMYERQMKMNTGFRASVPIYGEFAKDKFEAELKEGLEELEYEREMLSEAVNLINQLKFWLFELPQDE